MSSRSTAKIRTMSANSDTDVSTSSTKSKPHSRRVVMSAVLDAAFRIAELEDQAAQQTLAMACSLISLIDLRDQYTGGHSARVAEYCRDIGMHYGLKHEDLEEVVLAA